MSILSALLKEAGHAPTKNSLVGRVFLSDPVTYSPELDRVTKLPRRSWREQPDRYSERFRKAPHASLLPVQAAALHELAELGSCNVVASLGGGKTLITALAPLVVGAKKPLFLVYARLIDKTIREFRQLADDWHICDSYTFLSVEKLSRAEYADYLDLLCPDLIVIDEAHCLGNAEGARFRRLRRYKEANPHVPIVPLTATPGTESISQYAHVQALVLGESSPLPLDTHTLREWCEALDTEVIGQRRPPGALGATLEVARENVGTRVEDTPGNIYSRSADSVDCSIYVTSQKIELSSEIDALVEVARHDMCLPDGRCFEELYNVATIVKQLGCGYAKVLDPTPPLAWREARSLWAAFAREVIRRGALDTPAQVKAAVRSGEIDDGGLLANWQTLEPTFTPRTITAWFDLSVLHVVSYWLSVEKGLVWVTQPTVGRRLAQLTGLPFFHAGGCDVEAGSIEAYSRSTGAILAVRPNMLGRNLQDRWHTNLYVTPPSSATEIDQSIGRTARRGQKQPTVEVTFLLSVRENWESVTSARASAQAEKALGKNNSSRLINCDWCVSDLATVNTWKGPRWQR